MPSNDQPVFKKLLFALAGSFLMAGVAHATPIKKLQADTNYRKDVPPEIENPEVLGIDKLPAHATLMPYATLQQALLAKRNASTLSRNLNGNWKFNWVTWPIDNPVDSYKPGYAVSRWKEIVEMPVVAIDKEPVITMPALSLELDKNGITIRGAKFSISFDKETGIISTIKNNRGNILLVTKGGLILHLWRV